MKNQRMKRVMFDNAQVQTPIFRNLAFQNSIMQLHFWGQVQALLTL
jgi:hypothetical protein